MTVQFLQQMQEQIELLEKKNQKLQSELNEWNKLKNPSNLHSNLLRGIPAQLDQRTFLHLAGNQKMLEIAAKLNLDRLEWYSIKDVPIPDDIDVVFIQVTEYGYISKSWVASITLSGWAKDYDGFTKKIEDIHATHWFPLPAFDRNRISG
ncbi:MAG TPA: hypothetical protein VFM18_24230 [Methanosarcina sp.]|nr:hypothetical protein [Methanosarcina sp.]